jgi:hypothetical protein
MLGFSLEPPTSNDAAGKQVKPKSALNDEDKMTNHGSPSAASCPEKGKYRGKRNSILNRASCIRGKVDFGGVDFSGRFAPAAVWQSI